MFWVNLTVAMEAGSLVKTVELWGTQWTPFGPTTGVPYQGERKEPWTNRTPHPGKVTVLRLSCLAALSCCVRFSSCWECWSDAFKDSASRKWQLRLVRHG